MMSDFVKKYQCERFSAQPGVKGQASIDRHDALVFQRKRLGIDYREIKLELEC
jgi:hypothetical protein